MNKLSKEQWIKVLEDMWQDSIDKNQRKVQIMQGCLTNGPVVRDTMNLNLCNDSNCPSCSLWHKWIQEGLKD